MTINFQNGKHERGFRATLSKMKSNDCYANDISVTKKKTI